MYDKPVVTNSHNHPADLSSVVVQKTMHTMKTRIKDILAKPSQIFAEEMCKLEDSIKGSVKAEENVKRTLRNHKSSGNPKIPASLSELKIEGMTILL